jgi:phosphonate transport system permease protein
MADVARRDPAALPRLLITLLALVLLWPGLHFSELDLTVLFDTDANRAMRSLLANFWPPAHTPDFLDLLIRSTLETLAIAVIGMALALLLALPASLLATRALSRSALHRFNQPSFWGRSLRWPVRMLLIVLRSVPEIVWALLFVRAVGLGPTAGVLAIAITYSGMLGKVYAEIFESVDCRPAQALMGAGASRLTAFCYGILPNAAGEMISYTVYRWECAIRASVVMGFVGAGGLGQQMELSLRMFAGGEVASILLVFLVLVLLADQLSRFLRSRLIDGRRPGGGWIALLTVACVILSFRFLGVDFSGLIAPDALHQMADFAAPFLSPDVSPTHLNGLTQATLETLAMSAIGTLLAAIWGLLLALPAAGRFAWAAQQSSRLILNGLRAIPELVWAALMVLAAGLGPNAGTLALALHTTGVLGRLFAEALENTPTTPAESIRMSGGSRIAAFCYGTLPGVWPQLVAYTLYRWENNIRMSSVLGFVGAGGLGQMLYFHLSLFQQAQAATVILAMLVLVCVVDGMSQRLRLRG